jgi:hypothetical protein
LAEDWRQLDERITEVSAEIEALAAQDEHCQRLMSVPGVGPIISSAVVAAIGTGAGFRQGRDFGAWLGLVPKQESTGDRTILGKISKHGNKYLRTLFVQAAHVVLVRRPHGAKLGLWPWIEAAGRRLHRNILRGALLPRCRASSISLTTSPGASPWRLHRPGWRRSTGAEAPWPSPRRTSASARPP